MAITEQGYQRPTFDDILTDLIEKAQELFGEDIDVSELTPLGKFLRIIAYDRALSEENAEQIYYARYPNSSNGVNLDRLLPFVGISRNPATPAQYEATVRGTAGYIIPYGFEVSTESNIIYYNTEETTIGEEGTCTIVVECTESGTIGNVKAEDITQIVNPDADVEEIVGTKIVTAGADEESDYELRQRFVQASAGMGSCNETALESALIRVPTVISANVIVNDTNETDADGRPPHSFTCFITGGVGYEAQIAETIYEKKPIGIKTHGTSSYPITDESGTEHIIYFSRTTNINVYVKMKLVTTTAFEGEAGIEKIINNVKSYINSLGVGNDVILSALYTYIYSVTGVKEVTLLQLSTDGQTYSADNIVVDDTESAICAVVEVT